MAEFGNTSRSRLNTAHPDLQLIFEHVITYWDCSILCGERGEVEQTKAYNEDKSKVQFPNSKHNSSPSMAVDAAPYPIDWDDLKGFASFGNYVVGMADALYLAGLITHRVRWGGDWNWSDRNNDPQSFDDLPHFELVSP